MKRIGIYTGMGYKVPFEDRVVAIKDAGFNVICLDFEKEMEPTETSWENQVKVCQKYNMPIETVHLTGSGTTKIWEDCETAEYVTNRLIEELRDMSRLGVEVGVAHITWGYDVPNEPNPNALDRFKRITEAAEKYNVKLGLENSVYAKQVRFVLDNIQSDHIGFCFDSGHENAFTHGENYLDSYADRLVAMHLHDNDGVHDQHKLPFDGTVDWNKTVAQLKKSQLFRESVILELARQMEYPMEELLRLGYERAIKLAEM